MKKISCLFVAAFIVLVWFQACFAQQAVSAIARTADEKLVVGTTKAFVKDRGACQISPGNKRIAFQCVSKSLFSRSFYYSIDGTETVKFEDVLAGTPLFAPGDKRLAYCVGEGGKWSVYNDEKKEGPYDDIGSVPATFKFAPDGSRLVYAAAKDGKWSVISDGAQDRNSYAGIHCITLSADGKRIAYVAKTADGKYVVVSDGAESEKFDMAMTPVFSPDGSKCVFGAKTGDKYSIYINGKSDGAKYDKAGTLVVFSPDSKRLAIAVEEKGKQTILLDGKPLFGKFDEILKFVFSPDGGSYYYFAAMGKNFILMSDGKIYDGYDSVLEAVFSPDGKKLSFSAQKGRDIYLIHDGREEKLKAETAIMNMTYSPDGKYFAYFMGEGKTLGESKWCAVVNGSQGKKYDAIYSLMLCDSGKLVFDGNDKIRYFAAFGPNVYRVEETLK